MTIMVAIAIVQVLLLIAQISCFVYGVYSRRDLFEFAYGFAIWGCMPNIALSFIA